MAASPSKVEFTSEGERLEGLLYQPPGTGPTRSSSWPAAGVT